MAYSFSKRNNPISTGLHQAYLRDRRLGSYALPFNDVEYQQELEPQQRDYVAVAKNTLSFAWHTAVNLWTKAGQW